MSNIQYIQNETAFWAFDIKVGQWIHQISSIPAENPDVCIVRGITWMGPFSSQKTYLIWCSLVNNYIGSVNVANITTQSSGAMFILNKPIGNSLTFQLHMIGLNGVALTDPAVEGAISIHLEFIKYKDTPPHA